MIVGVRRFTLASAGDARAFALAGCKVSRQVGDVGEDSTLVAALTGGLVVGIEAPSILPAFSHLVRKAT